MKPKRVEQGFLDVAAKTTEALCGNCYSAMQRGDRPTALANRRLARAQLTSIRTVYGVHGQDVSRGIAALQRADTKCWRAGAPRPTLDWQYTCGIVTRVLEKLATGKK